MLRAWPMRACSLPVQDAAHASRRSAGQLTRSRDSQAPAAASAACAAASAASASERSVGSVSSEFVGARTGLGAGARPPWGWTKAQLLDMA